MKRLIYRLIIPAEKGDVWSKMFDLFIMALILMSVTALMLESVEEVYEKYGIQLVRLNSVIVVIFTIEYLLRIYVSDITHPAKTKVRSALKFIFSAYGIIDLLAILPFYIPMILKMDMLFVRMLRFARFLRILKLNRYSSSMAIIWVVIKEKRSELAVTGFVAFLILLLASFIMFHVEGDKQPEAFPHIFSAFWWAIATLTTVGYGDVYPITGLGKFLSAIIAISGIGLVALPTGLISAGFMSKIEEQKHSKEKTGINCKCPKCGEEFTNPE